MELVHTAVLNGLTITKEFERALELKEHVMNMNVPIDQHFWGAVIKMLCESNQINMAIDCIHSPVARDLPNSVFYLMVLKACIRSKQYSKAQELYQIFRNKNTDGNESFQRGDRNVMCHELGSRNNKIVQFFKYHVRCLFVQYHDKRM